MKVFFSVIATVGFAILLDVQAVIEPLNILATVLETPH